MNDPYPVTETVFIEVTVTGGPDWAPDHDEVTRLVCKHLEDTLTIFGRGNCKAQEITEWRCA